MLPENAGGFDESDVLPLPLNRTCVLETPPALESNVPLESVPVVRVPLVE
jgi:hypothetical protein